MLPSFCLLRQNKRQQFSDGARNTTLNMVWCNLSRSHRLLATVHKNPIHSTLLHFVRSLLPSTDNEFGGLLRKKGSWLCDFSAFRFEREMVTSIDCILFVCVPVPIRINHTDGKTRAIQSDGQT
jgi:hypothetical protein